ncbi:MAG TPA: multicopper oxidase domain-containing protein [Steroidobacteraceae bacterium]|nr:multicopper oxidase domain-containing protein [Steroidobacteraceae bacterium]
MKLRATLGQVGLIALLIGAASPVLAQSFRVQCPTSTITHPSSLNNNNAEPTYNGPTALTTTPVSGTSGGYSIPNASVNGAIKCQQVSGGDGYSTMANGTQTYMFSFGPLSGLADIAKGQPGTEFGSAFNVPYNQAVTNGVLVPGDPATTDGIVVNTWPTWPTPLATSPFNWNGAVGLAPDQVILETIYDISQGTTGNTVYVQLNSPSNLVPGSTVVIAGTGAPSAGGYDGTWTVDTYGNGTTIPYTSAYTFPTAGIPGVTNYAFPPTFNFTFKIQGVTGLADVLESQTATASTQPVLDGHVDPRQIMDIGVMNGNIPAPLIAVDEDDELFLTLTNVGMIMRPDLFEQHTIHWHGYPNASAVYDGVPDASVAINIGGSFTYYYLSPDAGTYFWHCHITPPEHLQMGMVGQLYVRPRQNRVPAGGSLYTYLGYQNGMGLPAGVVPDGRTVCNPGADILCSATMPAVNTGAVQGSDKLGNSQKYVYNDGDGSTAYDVEYPLQIHGFDPNFHFVGMTFNPEMFVDMKSKFFLLNGRSYPDTVTPGPMATQSSDGRVHYSQPLPAIINIPAGGKALLRIADLAVDEYATLASLGIPMMEVGFNAKLLRDQSGNNMAFYTNSITLGGGESLDVILDASDAGCGSAGCAAQLYPAGSVFYLYTPNLDHLSNDQENFGGLMTEVHICNSVTGGNTFGNTCN